ncbi:MAG TPA: 1,4-beta-xylanase, partial [Marinilabiliaceae bacterium]|nr:1,4-beta-xylanase [Marinilabiliaceae bacterium]
MAKPGLSAGKGKYIGNIISHLSPESDYLSYWNGVTAENASKWGSVEPYQGMMNWTNSDMVYNYAK